ncbi:MULTISPECIES: SDR family NAD(P)-dependent oxidoreductase [unclassified Pseudomonas]|uniref:SDR family NAD(P)-dependent oxidoreductase n=1 Tax=unclassified Pseudomonas TaxID=196821 RepID=UPI000C86AD99|nr:MULTISPECIES: SDR family oxidoreductase [unclassified Pseudomonas]PMV22661.1 oxidoreductase [Pseudomonas sp. FW305-3-2-15-C-TSA2]PMV29324.1 oxidoreductase [Pseudomonas sp. DP16D-L5]PMV39227.1 oxidoreductase [Pseudomonas sp. FW305-3-2-15-A-LB2]PMV45537.1 oxidoreductase [Pseudomonas sp. FW305-3-2-15-C-R2A1]PMV52020.1 oxidoreductase [Pseudomonas sp. FW305-3-2-15-C-LB1]
MSEKKTLLLTGASRGIGHATVKHFNAAGWRVFTASRQSWATDCPWADGQENHIHLDLEDIGSIEASIDLIKEKLGDGKLHALVDNAGMSPKGPQGGRLGVLETDYATWLQVFNVNLFSTALLARGLFAELKAAQGTIINVTSIAGSRVHPFAGVAYATSKAALSALTREMAYDYGQHGIRVNAIAPGEIDTSILSPGTQDIVERNIPMHRLGKPEEVASLIHFLCTSGASYINGAEIQVNGGQHV